VILVNTALWLCLAGCLAAFAHWARRNVDALVSLLPADDRERRLRRARAAARGCYLVALLFAAAGIVSVFGTAG
jgi:hypothetical protein